MKLYDTKLAPNPRRVRIFLAEKGIDVPKVEVDLAKTEQKSSEYSKINPLQRTPALVLDDARPAVVLSTAGVAAELPLPARQPLGQTLISSQNRP